MQLNNSWEFSPVPYIPVFHHFYENLRNMLMVVEPNAVQLNWTMGGYPSPVFRMFAEMTRKDVPMPTEAELLQKLFPTADYDALKNIPRPGHADYAAWMKYGLDFDMSGGGPFSGRMTAPLCIAGGLCKQWLEQRGIRIGAHILYISTGTHCDMEFDALSPELDDIDPDFPTLLPAVGAEIQASLAALKADGDSAGGYIECAVTGLPAGIGGPLFGGVESHLAQIVYGIPAVKALEFGNSEGCVDMVGSLYNGEYLISDGKVVLDSNCAGGVLGGITTGMPLIFRVGFKPTPSIAKPQRSVNLKTMEEVTIKVKGRHDPCIVPRAVPVVEAAAAIAIFDMILSNTQTSRRK
jgi:chorismate synthase